jgi:hypothetical protein
VDLENFNIIHHLSSPGEARLPNGRMVYREEKLLVKEMKKFVVCAPYDNHFIYESNIPQMSSYMCTCGAPAVIIGANQYKQDASPTDTGELFVCFFHASLGKHADGTT